jgi:phenylacetic acid degradation operon negative regulatory protein
MLWFVSLSSDGANANAEALSSVLRPRSGSSAKALLLTILGEFVLPRGGSVWTQTLIDALRVVGVDEPNARQALLRVSEQGVIAGDRTGRRVRRVLTPMGIELLEASRRQIYGFGRSTSEWDRRWLLVFCPVPEDQRAKRQVLRNRLGFEGFGFLGPTVAITPHLSHEEPATVILKELDLVDKATIFRCEAAELISNEEIVRRAWDLQDLDQQYRDFIEAFRQRAARTSEEAFTAAVDLVHQWRRFPFIDPQIPARLLPSDWRGKAACDVFDERRMGYSADAHDYFRQLEFIWL